MSRSSKWSLPFVFHNQNFVTTWNTVLEKLTATQLVMKFLNNVNVNLILKFTVCFCCHSQCDIFISNEYRM
jgi:hypothetical protein